MVGLWVVYGMGVVAGIGIPVVVLIGERRVGQDVVRVGLESLGSSLPALAMLGGGPGRVVDAVVTDLVERGLVSADSGALTAARDPDAGAEEFTSTEVLVIGAVRHAGSEGIRGVRREASQVRAPFEAIVADLVQHRLLVGPLRRKGEPTGLALGVLTVLALATVGMVGEQTAGALAVVGWVPVTLLTGYLASRRRGYSGPDPRSALGMACLARLQTDLPDEAPQAHRVAAGGFAAMTDTPLRKAIQGSRTDSTWRIPLQRSQASGIDLLTLDLARPADD